MILNLKLLILHSAIGLESQLLPDQNDENICPGWFPFMDH